MKFQVARVLPDAVNHLLTQTSGEFRNPEFFSYNFDENNISEIFSEIQPFDNSDPSKEQYTALDLSKYVGKNKAAVGPQGLFLLTTQGWDSKNNTSLSQPTKRLILITDMGLVVKDNADNSHDVFVQSITQGRPVVNAEVVVLGRNGLPITTQHTDVNGRVSFPALQDYINEQEPTVYLAKLNDDISFIPYKEFDRRP